MLTVPTKVGLTLPYLTPPTMREGPKIAAGSDSSGSKEPLLSGSDKGSLSIPIHWSESIFARVHYQDRFRGGAARTSLNIHGD